MYNETEEISKLKSFKIVDIVKNVLTNNLSIFYIRNKCNNSFMVIINYYLAK